MTPLRTDTRVQASLVLLPWSQTGEEAGSLRSLLATTPASMAVTVPGNPVQPLLAELAGDRLDTMISAPGLKPGAILNAVARERPGADLVVIADDVLLPAGWLPAVAAAAHSDDGVAMATTLATGEADPELGRPGDLPASVDAQQSLHPRVLWPWPHCAWIRRRTWELLGGFDSSLTHVAAVLVEFGARALTRGVSCALPGELCLERTGTGLGPWPGDDFDRLVRAHPWLSVSASAQTRLEPEPLRRVARRLSRRQRPLTVTVDARALGTGVGGSQTYVVHLLQALAAAGELSVRAIVGSQAPATVTGALGEAGIELVTEGQAASGQIRSDIAHRPQQVFARNDLALLRASGERAVISHMDLLLYRNPAYHASAADWLDYRHVTRMALGMADATLFFSEHARSDALSEDLVDPTRTSVASIGAPTSPGEDGRRPAQVPPDRPLLLVLGSDYAHKNRPFAMVLADELRRRHGWSGTLVLAGPHQPYGSSADAEQRLLRERPELAACVLDLGPVDETEKHWLLANAEAQILASDYEGFGLAPLESAAVKRPCIYAACTSLREVVDPAAASIVPWDAEASADAAARLLRPGRTREHHLSLLGQALTRHSWTAVAGCIIDAYRAALESPPRGGASLAAEALSQGTARRELQERVAYGQLLIDEQGGLLSRAQQRGLMRVASRPWLRGPLLWPFGLLGSDQHERLDA